MTGLESRPLDADRPKLDCWRAPIWPRAQQELLAPPKRLPGPGANLVASGGCRRGGGTCRGPEERPAEAAGTPRARPERIRLTSVGREFAQIGAQVSALCERKFSASSVNGPKFNMETLNAPLDARARHSHLNGGINSIWPPKLAARSSLWRSPSLASDR